MSLLMPFTALKIFKEKKMMSSTGPHDLHENLLYINGQAAFLGYQIKMNWTEVPNVLNMLVAVHCNLTP